MGSTREAKVASPLVIELQGQVVSFHFLLDVVDLGGEWPASVVYFWGFLACYGGLS